MEGNGEEERRRERKGEGEERRGEERRGEERRGGEGRGGDARGEESRAEERRGGNRLTNLCCGRHINKVVDLVSLPLPFSILASFRHSAEETSSFATPLARL